VAAPCAPYHCVRGPVRKCGRGGPFNGIVSRHMERETKKQLEKMNEHLTYIDETALIVLKGHLLIEEALGEIIETFVHHADQLENARLTFAQKVAVARSMSLDEHSNSMWQLIASLNSLRNELSHSLKSEKRATKTKDVLDLYAKQGGVVPKLNDGKDAPEAAMMSMIVAMSLGFLSTFIEEVRRFRGIVNDMDKVVNPHRYK
jgi:hypothetical protein